MSRGMPSMTALLALLAMAGYQNRDKISDILGNLTQGNANSGALPGPDGHAAPGQDAGHLPGQESASADSGGLGGLGGLLGGLFGGAAAGGAASQTGGLGGILGELGGMLGGGASAGSVADDAARNPADTLNRGVGDLMDHFRQNGLGDEADSWVGQGANKEVAPSQIENSLDPQVLDALAKQIGISREELLGRLAQNLPSAVNKLTQGT